MYVRSSIRLRLVVPQCVAEVKRAMSHPKQLYRPTSPGRVKPSQTMTEKKQWMEERRKKNVDENLVAINSGLKNPWMYKSAIIVERPQVLSPLPEPWFAKYQEWRLRWDRPILQQYPPITVLDEDIEENKKKQEQEKKAAKDRERILATETEEEKKERLVKESREERLKAIRAGHKREVIKKKRSRFTEADRQGDTRSVYRALDRKLFLIVKKSRNEHSWQFPQGTIKDGETLRSAAEREFREECNVGGELECYFSGNGPLGYLNYAFEPQLQKKSKTYGAKVFFMYAYYIQGQVGLNTSELADYKWVTREELAHYLHPSLYTCVDEFLPSDGLREQIVNSYYIGVQRKADEAE
eukprot:TRINITY_DN3301_c0_g1_i14.p1 TRINITY_DN3301_c0_g1~~TRINITY_DN3301_c0_g1_i14.p1  ORF type:complete len:354 (+),score=66.99 TRINITY_DN3301_c0_g1_i14:110-1171(+)